MKSMNLFGGNDKSNEVLFGNSKPKEIIKPKETTNQSLSAPIQDEDGNLTFELEGKTYSLNVNSKEERERVKEEIDTNSLTKYDWFKEETGEKHWVLYNTEMYEINYDGHANRCIPPKHLCTLCTLTHILRLSKTSNAFRTFIKIKNL